MSNTGIIAHINLKEDESLVVQKNKERTRGPNYYKVGNGTMNKDKVKARDFIGELISLGKPAQKVIGWIKDGMTYNAYTEKVDFVVKVVATTPMDKKNLKIGLKELFEKDLVRRVKRGYYMIDPHALIVDYKKQLEIWDSLDTKTSKD